MLVIIISSYAQTIAKVSQTASIHTEVKISYDFYVVEVRKYKRQILQELSLRICDL